MGGVIEKEAALGETLASLGSVIVAYGVMIAHADDVVRHVRAPAR